MTLKQMKQAALKLSPNERIKLAHHLIQTVSEDHSQLTEE
jgi:hypothetical protein